MSLLDVRQAKQALTWRLTEWGVENAAEMADSFIDDLVGKGWRMDASRELRAEVPKPHQACPECSGFVGQCGCRVRGQIVERDEPEPRRMEFTADASLARALLAETKAGLCGHGVPLDNCNEAHEATEATP